MLLNVRADGPILSSVGLGPTFTWTWRNEDFARRSNFGATVSAGLLADKLRVSYGVRSFSRTDFAGDDIFWHIGVNDVPGVLYWLARGRAPK